MQVRVSEQGQLTIPAPIREQLGIVPGSWLEIEADHGVLRASVIQPIYAESPVPSGLGLAGYRGRRLEIEEMDPLRAGAELEREIEAKLRGLEEIVG